MRSSADKEILFFQYLEGFFRLKKQSVCAKYVQSVHLTLEWHSRVLENQLPFPCIHLLFSGASSVPLTLLSSLAFLNTPFLSLFPHSCSGRHDEFKMFHVSGQVMHWCHWSFSYDVQPVMGLETLSGSCNNSWRMKPKDPLYSTADVLVWPFKKIHDLITTAN